MKALKNKGVGVGAGFAKGGRQYKTPWEAPPFPSSSNKESQTHSQPCSICDGKVMVEYIGATDVPISFDDVPIDPNIDFYFILGFAIDANPSGEPQNGVFSPYWIPTIIPDSVTSIKARHPNVKVMASLSGWSMGDKVLHWYDPNDTEAWISNAFNSLQSLVATYSLDGIDIDYEVFPQNGTTFVYCIGELIARLKNHVICL